MCFQCRFLRMYHKNFQHFPRTESIEVTGPTICGLDTQKSHFFGVFFAVFSGTAHELMVPAQPPNTHPSPRLMQKEPRDLPNLLRRGTISGVRNVTLYCKIATVTQLFRWVYKWPLAQWLYKTLEALFLYQKYPRYRALKIGFFVLELVEQISNSHCSARTANIKKNAVIKTKERLE